MGFRIKMTEREFPTIPADAYVVECTGINENPNDRYGATWNLEFTILTEGEYKGMKVWGKVSAVLSPGNKLDRWLQAMGITTLEIGEEFDSDEVIGRKCKVVIKNNKSGDKIYSNVDDILELNVEEKAISKSVKETPAPVKATPIKSVTPKVTTPASTPKKDEDATPKLDLDLDDEEIPF